MMFEPMSASIEPVRTGKLRALAVTTSERSAALPDVPTLAESVPGFEASAVTGIGVPKGTPAEIIETLNKAVQAAFADAAMKAKLADTGGAPLPGTAADFAAADGGGDREVGQGGEGGRDQGGVSRAEAPSSPSGPHAEDPGDQPQRGVSKHRPQPSAAILRDAGFARSSG